MRDDLVIDYVTDCEEQQDADDYQIYCDHSWHCDYVTDDADENR